MLPTSHFVKFSDLHGWSILSRHVDKDKNAASSSSLISHVVELMRFRIHLRQKTGRRRWSYMRILSPLN